MDEIKVVTRFSWAIIVGLAAVLTVVAWLAWPGPPPPDASRAREYRDYDMCLLTDSQGLNGAEAAAVWRAVHEISLQTKVRASFLSVSGEQTRARAAQFVATQVQQRCGIIVAVGDNQTAAAAEAAAKYPNIRFVIVGGSGQDSANLSNVDATGVGAHVTSLIPPQ